MTTKLLCPGLFLIFFTLVCTVPSLQAQQPIIESLSRNGELVTMNMEPGSEATVEWAPTVTGPWSDTWAGLQGVVADSIGTIRVEVPMFYRVRSSILANPDPARLVRIAPGTFLMGSPDSEVDRNNDEGPQTTVTISKGFWMGRFEVTQQEYTDLFGGTPSSFQPPEYTADLNRPVESVTWNDATNYCAVLTNREQDAGRIPLDYEYRLPTEAEWEYACRAGTTTRFSHGDDPGYTNLGDYAWYGGNNTPDGTKPVGGKLPNPWGLHDMHGNVYEWCQDLYGSSYPGGSVTDPTGLGSGSSHVLRGGYWDEFGGGCRSALRDGGGGPAFASDNVGFRVVLAPVRLIEPTANMVFIEPGTFIMGSPDTEEDRNNDEGPQTTVTISRGYWMGKYEVTQQEYIDVTGLSNPSNIKPPTYTEDLNRPVERVSWNDAISYCAALTTQERNAGRITSGYEYRLPTEAEWEYACRAGTTTRFSYGDDPGYFQLELFGWYIDNSDTGSGIMTHPVGQKFPNPWGLYDMHGNVFEWCQDWYGNYPGGSVTDPTGLGSGSIRVFRGGGWFYRGWSCRSAGRYGRGPTIADGLVGFRVVLAPVQ
jgi:formylglycine-generating enzyme required for sulfatase activity